MKTDMFSMDFNLDYINPEEEEGLDKNEEGEGANQPYSGESLTNATNVIMLPIMHAIWGDIWKGTVEKSQTNAANVTMPPHGQAIWGDIWKHTVKKSQTNATSVIMHPLEQTF